MRGSSLIHCCHSLMEKKKKNQNIKINIKNLKRQTSHRMALAYILPDGEPGKEVG